MDGADCLATGRYDLREFSWVLLIVDVLIALLLLAAATIGTERWIRRRRALWRWRLLDLAVVVTLVAVGLGYWKQAAVKQQRDARLAPGAVSDDRSVRAVSWEYRGPRWLVRLAGGRGGLECFDRVTQVKQEQLTPSPDGWSSVRRLTALEHFEIVAHRVSVSEIDALASIPRLRSLSWGNAPAEVLSHLPRLRQVTHLTLFQCQAPEADVERLQAEMPWAEVIARR